jgi:hypothetical protein
LTAWTTHEIDCDGRIPAPKPDKPDATRACFKKYEPPEGTPVYSTSPSELRRLAAKDGWTRVRSSIGRRWDRDLCPDHKPQGEDRG